MAVTWDIETEESISFAELIAYFDGLGADVLKKNLDASALMLRRLYNNRSFLVDVLLAQLADIPSFERVNGYTSQVFMLHSSPHYFVRAAIWEPRTPAGDSSAEHRRSTEEIFLYEDAHDHNMNLLTLGYLGSGYRTILFEYEHATTVGYPGESVPVRFLEETSLPEGRILLYRESRDIHAQFPPNEFSISINVISTGSKHVRQYAFDIAFDPGTTSAVIRKHLVGHMPPIFAQFAQSMGVENVTGRLESVLASNILPPARLALMSALAHVDNNP